MNELVRLAKEGDQIAVNKLYSQCEDMIKHYCRKYKNLCFITHDDLVQQCTIYFMDSIRKFDLSKDLKFTTFLYSQLIQVSRTITYEDFVITRRADYMSRVKKDPEEALRSVSIDQKKNEDGETWADNLVDTNSTPEDRYNSAQTTSIIKDEILKVLRLYTDAEQKYLIDHFDMYEIIGLEAPSEEQEFEIVNGRRNTIRKTFQNKLKYSKKICRDMLY